MAEAITDRQLVAVLRPFVRAAGPVLEGLRESDPFGLRSRVLRRFRLPGTPAWASMDVDARCDWWVSRVGRFTAALASIPGIGGALADRLPVTDALGAAGQGLLLCAIAGEHGVEDVGTRVLLLGAVLFGREIDPAVAAGQPSAEEQQRVEELTGELRSRRLLAPTAVAGAIWRLGRMLWSVPAELGRRPHGRWYHRLVGAVPVVGIVGDYLGERSGLKRASRAGCAWIRGRQGARQAT